MNNIFAIDPGACEDFKDLKYLLDYFGYSEGRFVGRIPKKWEKMVYSHIADWPDGAKHKASELLIKFCNHHPLLSLGYQYEPERSWLENAMDAKGKNLVTDVIAVRGCSADSTPIDEVDRDYFGRWGGRQFEALSSPEGYADAAMILLSESQEVVIVDPYLGTFNGGFKSVLSKMAVVAARAKKCKKFIVYTLCKGAKTSHLTKGAPHFFKPIIDCGVAVEFNVVEMNGNPAADDHGRFIF